MVFSVLYPIEPNQYSALRDALEKLRLNDSSFFYEPETSTALGFGFRCGFLGLLHLEIVQERLEREFDLSLITTAPGVRYRVTTNEGEVVDVDNPTRLPPPSQIDKIEEPVVTSMITDPSPVRRAAAETAGRKARRPEIHGLFDADPGPDHL